jgi:hypothetical protein
MIEIKITKDKNGNYEDQFHHVYDEDDIIYDIKKGRVPERSV